MSAECPTERPSQGTAAAGLGSCGPRPSVRGTVLLEHAVAGDRRLRSSAGRFDADRRLSSRVSLPAPDVHRAPAGGSDERAHARARPEEPDAGDSPVFNRRYVLAEHSGEPRSPRPRGTGAAR